MTAVQIYVADAHPVCRDGVVHALTERPDFEVVGQTGEGRTCLEDLKRMQPDVALLELRIPDLDGIEIVRALKRDEVPTRVVLLSATDGELVFQALEAGAVAYLVKDATGEEIRDAVAAAARGETALPPAVQGQLVSGIHERASEDEPALSAREHEILALTAEGLSAPDIGRRIHLSGATIKSHLQRIYEKLSVSDRAAAVAEGIRRGLLD